MGVDDKETNTASECKSDSSTKGNQVNKVKITKYGFSVTDKDLLRKRVKEVAAQIKSKIDKDQK